MKNDGVRRRARRLRATRGRAARATRGGRSLGLQPHGPLVRGFARPGSMPPEESGDDCRRLRASPRGRSVRFLLASALQAAIDYRKEDGLTRFQISLPRQGILERAPLQTTVFAPNSSPRPQIAAQARSARILLPRAEAAIPIAERTPAAARPR